MRIAIVNQFAPPDESPTSVLAGDLAEGLIARGHEVELISCDGGYRSRRSFRGSRLLHELRAHLGLFRKCLKTKKPDVLIALSSPACLSATVSFAARLKRCRFSHWAMDVYPDVAVALGEVSENGLVHKVTKNLMQKAYRRANPLVALTGDMEKALGGDAKICPPWPPKSLQWPDTAPSAPTTFIWLYSGNLGRAHLFRPLLLAQELLEKRGVSAQLVFQGGGHLVSEAKQFAKELGLKNCLFRDYAPREELIDSLMQASALVATQAPETDGLLWPSKLAVIRHIPRPLLWVGNSPPSVDANTFAPEDHVGIARWVKEQVNDPSEISYSPPLAPTSALDDWHRWLSNPTL